MSAAGNDADTMQSFIIFLIGTGIQVSLFQWLAYFICIFEYKLAVLVLIANNMIPFFLK